MEIRKMILFVMLSCFSITLFADSTLFLKLKETTALKEGEKLAVIYQTNGSCIKCYMKPTDKIKKMQEKGKLGDVKILALVRCSRDIELQVFKKNHGWKNYTYRDDGTAKKKLGVKSGSYLTIFDFDGNILFDFE